MSQSLIVAILAVSAAFSFFLSGFEAGALALSRWRIRQQMQAGRRRAKVLHQYLQKPDGFLWTILVGNTLAAFAFFSFLALELYQNLADHPALFGVAYAALVFCFYALCDLLPKMLFRQFPNRLTLLLVIPFQVVHYALAPLVSLMSATSKLLLKFAPAESRGEAVFGSRSEFRWVMQESGANLSSEEMAMINRVLDAEHLSVRSVTTPLDRVISASQDTPARAALDLCRHHNLTRLPLWSGAGKARRVAGIFTLQSFLHAAQADPEQPASRYAKRAFFVQEGWRLEDALRRMQRSRHRIAVVLGKDHRELGIVSIEDILKALLGEVKL